MNTRNPPYEPRYAQRLILDKLAACDASEGCLLSAAERRNVGVLVVMNLVHWVQPVRQPKKRIYFLTEQGRRFAKAPKRERHHV